MIKTEENVLSDICEMLSKIYPEVEVTMDTYFEYGQSEEDTALNMSSLEIVQFIVNLEDRYDIIIDLEDRYYTVGDAVRSIVSYLKER